MGRILSDTIEFEDPGKEPRLQRAASEREREAVTPSIPGYEILEELGKGGMGVVFKARQLGLNRLVALKVLRRTDLDARPEDSARFRTEAEAIARIDHPHIVRIYEIGEAEGAPYFSLEYCAGGNLATRQAGTSLSPMQAAPLVEKLARAVAAAHAAQVIHGDLKPANVLLTPSGEPKISDFGLARRLDRDPRETTETSPILGTPSYMAPEQAAGQPMGPAADLYGLGAILYELLTGRPPFRAWEAWETIRQVRTQEPVPPSQIHPRIPDYLEAICLRCLRKDPHQRFASATELAEALHRIQTPEILCHSLIESLRVSTFRKDLAGHFTFVNTTFCQTIGQPLDKVLGRTDYDLFPFARAEKYRRDEEGVLAAGGVFEDIEEHQSSACGPCCRCGGSLRGENEDALIEPRRYIQVLLTAVYDPGGKVSGTQGAFWNVQARMLTELKKTASDLERANRELARSNADLEQFAYVASHDLQEPLRMVASYTRLLQHRYKGKLDAEADEYIAFAVDGASRMQGLINDLLQYARITTGAKPPQETSCNEVFDQAVKNLEAVIKEKGAMVTRANLPMVWADPTQMIQLFQNLITNGIKFCHSQTPIIQVSAVLRQDDQLFAVRDNGIGIEPRHAGRIFAIFQRLHTRERYPGNGIGLAICQKIVERHGGRIWVESQPGSGSTFYFTLPLEWFDAKD
jgi:signal transduction histidine kinase/serine/threonine protein kinase